jgi:hypothetical protein
VAAGYDAIKAARTEYLKKHPKESAQSYEIRLSRPVLFNAFRRTVDGLVGMVFRRNPELADDVPAPITEHWGNIDNEGNHGDVFLKNVFSDAMIAGHAAILVDYPRVGGQVTLAEEKARNLRPYWVHVRLEDIVNFRTTRIDGQRVLEQVTIRTVTNEPDGEFGDEPVTRYTTYRRGNVAEPSQEQRIGVRWSVELVGDDGEPHPTGEVGVVANVTEIPLVPVYGRYTGVFESVPPLKDLADRNILHYQTTSDYFHAQHIACVPMLAIIGAQEDASIEVGPNTALELPKDAKAEWIETSGAALGHTRQMLQDLNGDMAVLGLSLLQGDKRAAETAEAKRLDKSEKDSALTTAARSLEDAVELLLGFHAQHMGLDAGGSVAVNRDFESQQMDPARIDAIARLVQQGDLSQDTLWQMLQEGEVLPDDFDPDVERERLASMPPPPPMPAPPGTADEPEDEE